MLSSGRRQARTTETRLALIRRDIGRMAENLDGLHGSEREVKQQSDLGLAAKDGCEWDQAIWHFLKAMKATRGVESAALSCLIGVCHYPKGRLDEARKRFEESARLAGQSLDERGKGQALGNIGLILHDKGDLDRALEYYGAALRISREAEDRRDLVYDLAGIGSIFGDKGDFDQALRYYGAALGIARETGDERGIVYCQAGVGSVYRDKREQNRALERYDESLARSRETGDVRGEANALANIGGIYRGQGRRDTGLRYIERALATARRAGYLLDVAIDLGNIGIVLMDKRSYQQAALRFAESLTILLDIGVADGPRQALLGLARCDEKLGRERMEKLFSRSKLNRLTIADLLKRTDQARQSTSRGL
jgi:tetratricopeptide (TPR) repeat protein